MDNNTFKTIVSTVRKLVIKASEKEEYENKNQVDNERLRNIIDITLKAYMKENSLQLLLNERKQISEDIYNSIRGLGVLQELIDDPQITEIMVNGPDIIFIEKKGRLLEYERCFEDEEDLMRIVKSIVENVNREINPSEPIADARLDNGSRVSAVVKPIALNGPILTIRKFPESPMTINQLIKYKSITQETAELLEALVKARYNIFVCGGTGSGKTTFLNALSNFIPKDERIITIEDSAELQIKNVKNLVRLETKNANVEGKGQISIRDLIKTSLRMRPDRIIVGEVRGPEALDMLQAMNTGHDGSLSTGHANSSRDILTRLETMVLMGADFPLDAIRQQIASALDIIVHLGRLRDKSRKVLEITEVTGYKDGNIELNPLYQFQDQGDDANGEVIGDIAFCGNQLFNQLKMDMSGIQYKGKVF